jgi:hypothetical protein
MKRGLIRGGWGSYDRSYVEWQKCCDLNQIPPPRNSGPPFHRGTVAVGHKIVLIETECIARDNLLEETTLGELIQTVIICRRPAW